MFQNENKIFTALMIATVIGTTACSKEAFQAADSVSPGGGSASNASVVGSTTTVTSPATTLNSQQVSSLGNVIAGILGDLFINLQGFNHISFMPGTQPLSINGSLTCPLGGSATVSGHGTFSDSLSLTQVTGSLTGGNAVVTLNGCVLAVAGGTTISVSGSINASLQGSLTGAVDILGGRGSFNAQGNNQVTANLQIVAGTVSESCAMTGSGTLSATGTATISSESFSGDFESQFTGQACGIPLSGQVSDPFQL